LAHLLRLIRREREQYVYVLQFGDRTVKVGQSWDAQRRIGQHHAEAHRHGASVVHSWFSPAHLDFAANEQRLISFCLKRYGAAASGREYFHSADYLEVLTYAKTLRFDALSGDDLNALVAARVQSDRAARTRFAAVSAIDIEREMAVLGSLANDANRDAVSSAAFDAVRRMIDLQPSPWTDSDPYAADRYLATTFGRSVRRADAAEFEADARSLFAITTGRYANTFAELAVFMDGAR
jgi:hypothetical protein